MLENPLQMARASTGFGLANLRMRVVQLMSRIGGTDSFGPKAVELQLAKLRRLELHTSYRRLLNVAAFQAMREAIGELDRANAISSNAVSELLLLSGAFSPIVPTIPPVARPIGVPIASLPNGFGSPKDDDWVAAVEEDLTRPYVEGFVVLAATAFNERRVQNENWCVEQYFGPDCSSGADNLFEQLSRLRQVILADRSTGPVRDAKPCGVVHPVPLIVAMSGYLSTLMLCPIVATRLGWRSDPNDVFTFTDSRGEIVAYTMYWRDGGLDSREYEPAVHRYGYVLLVREDQVSEIQPFLAQAYVSRAWRRIQTNVRGQGIGRSGSRTELPPV